MAATVYREALDRPLDITRIVDMAANHIGEPVEVEMERYGERLTFKGKLSALFVVGGRPHAVGVKYDDPIGGVMGVAVLFELMLRFTLGERGHLVAAVSAEA